MAPNLGELAARPYLPHHQVYAASHNIGLQFYARMMFPSKPLTSSRTGLFYRYAFARVMGAIGTI